MGFFEIHKQIEGGGGWPKYKKNILASKGKLNEKKNMHANES